MPRKASEAGGLGYNNIRPYNLTNPPTCTTLWAMTATTLPFLPVFAGLLLLAGTWLMQGRKPAPQRVAIRRRHERTR